MQLGVAIAAGVLAERGDHPLPGVLPPATRVVPGSGLASFPLQVVEGSRVPLHDRVPDAVGDVLPGLNGLQVTVLGCGDRVR